MAITLESLQRGQTIEPPRILLYGIPGIGKSTFAAEAPNPVFIFTEKGKGRLSVTNFPIAKSWDDVNEALGVVLNDEHDFETLVIDTIDWLEKLIFEKVCVDENKASIEDFGYGKGYTRAVNYWNYLLETLDEISEKRGMGIILIGHSTVKLFNSPDTDNYDQYQLKLHQKTAAILKEWPDCVLFANYEVKVKKLDDGFDKGKAKGKAVRMNDVPRLIHTQERPAFWAKNRYNLVPTLPLEWAAFQQAVEAGIDEEKEVTEQLRKSK